MFEGPHAGNIGQAIAFVEDAQAAQVIMERAMFLPNPILNPYARKE